MLQGHSSVRVSPVLFQPPLWGPSDSEMWGLQESHTMGCPVSLGPGFVLPPHGDPPQAWVLSRQGHGQSHRDSDRDRVGITVAGDAGNSGYQLPLNSVCVT